MASRTRAAVVALTTRVSLMTWLTVAVETPARSATVRIVATRAPLALRRAVIVYVPDFAACYQGVESLSNVRDRRTISPAESPGRRRRRPIARDAVDGLLAGDRLVQQRQEPLPIRLQHHLDIGLPFGHA